MANTLKFGAGEWATKEGSTLAYNDENGNFKPLPFNFERAGSATRVNKDGLIEVVSNNEPRIDYKDNSEGALLLEPTRTNRITYSEDFSQSVWTDFNVTLNSSQSSPNGNSNAYLIEPTNSSFLLYTQSSVIASTEYTFSYFFKSGTKDAVKIAFYDDTANSFIETNATQSFVDYGNGWKRIITSVTTPLGCTSLYSYIDRSSEVGTFYVWGAQLEQGSYATSYIPTQGGIGTRVAESCQKQNIFNNIVSSQFPFSFFVEADYKNQDDYFFSFINPNRNDSWFTIRFISGQVVVISSSVAVQETFNTGFFASNSERVKIAITYDSVSKIRISINGNDVLVKSNFNSQAVNTLINTILLGQLRIVSDNGLRNGILDFKAYNEALTDQELINLTRI